MNVSLYIKTGKKKKKMDKGILVASARGMGHSVIKTVWIFCLGSAFVCAVGGLAISFIWEWNNREVAEKALNGSYGSMAVEMARVITGGTGNDIVRKRMVMVQLYCFLLELFSLVCAVLSLVMAGEINSRVSKTIVNVYENVIEGIGVVPKFPLSFMLYGSISSLQLAEFQLTYDKVFSVDVVNLNTVVINAPSVQHKIYAMNAREVRDAIMSQKDMVEGK
jgi:hypothetical protein